MSGFDALVFNTLRAGEMTLTEDERAGMKDYISAGAGFVCIHISGCVPDGWQEYREITGGGWVMGVSYHPPYGEFTVNVTQPEHPGVAGVSDFSTTTSSTWAWSTPTTTTCSCPATPKTERTSGAAKRTFMAGGTFPLAWTRSYGEGKVFVTLLGHNGLSFETPEFQKVVLNGIEWAAGG